MTAPVVEPTPDGFRLGADLEEREMAVIDARTAPPSGRPTLTANELELIERPMADPALDSLDHEAVVRACCPECAGIVRAATGATTVAAFDHNVRSATGKAGGPRIAGGQGVQEPAHLVHGDYTLTSAPRRLREPARPPSLNDTCRTVLADAEGGTLPAPSAVGAIQRDRAFRPMLPVPA